MFGFLKDKLKSAIKKFTTDVKEEVDEKVEKVEKIEKVEVKEKPVSKHAEPKPEPKKDSKKETEHKPHSKKTEEVKIIEKKEKPSEEKHSHKTEKTEKTETKVKHEEKLEPKVDAKKIEKAEVKEHKKQEVKPEIIETKKHIPSHKSVEHHVKPEEKIKVHEKPEQKSESKPDIKHPIKHEKAEISENKLKEIKKEEIKKETVIEEKVEVKETKKEEPKKGFFGKLFSKKSEPTENVVKEEKEEKEEKPVHAKKEEPKHEEPKVEYKKETKKEQVKEEPKEDKKGFFEKLTEVVTKKTLSEEKFDELFFELEVAMLENNVALEVIDKIKVDLKKSLLSEKVSRVKTEEIIAESLKNSIDELFDVETFDLLDEAKNKKPYVICFVGVNGSGKTTNLAKLANYFQKNGLSVVIAACDTFRAAAIQQVEEHAKNLNVKLIKHDYGADAAAVAYDAIEHAKARGLDIVLIDTAGRSHANVNLMEELEKVVRVSKPDIKIFVGDSLTGNDAVDQAKSFNEKVGIDGIILSKVDVDEKGGAAISVSYITQKPILFVGTGQTYDDFEKFDKEKIIQNLGF